MGRPTKYDPSFNKKVTQFARLGATNDDLALLFDVTTTTIENWMKDKKEFFGAIKKGKEESDAKVGQRLYERACGYSHPDVHISNFQGVITKTKIIKHYPPETIAMIFWLKNRRPDLWRDKQEIEKIGKDFKEIKINIVRP